MIRRKAEPAVFIIYLNVSHHIPQFKSLHFYNLFRGVLFSDYMLSIQYILSYPDRLERFIEEMSRYLAANGKSYQNYAAALRIWAGNDKKEAPKKGIPDYSCKEGESL